MTFSEGDVVGVPCSIQPGPFPDERLIAVDTAEGLLSGFVDRGNLQAKDDDESGFVKGMILELGRNSVTVKLCGSFFTSAMGIASVKPNGLTRLAA